MRLFHWFIYVHYQRELFIYLSNGRGGEFASKELTLTDTALLIRTSKGGPEFDNVFFFFLVTEFDNVV